MDYQHPHGGGEQGWRQQHDVNPESGGRLWSREMVSEETEGMSHSDAAQRQPDMYQTTWNGVYDAPVSNITYSYESIPAQLSAGHRPAVSNSFFQVNASSSTGSLGRSETSVIPQTRYYQQADHTSGGFAPLRQCVVKDWKQTEAKVLMITKATRTAW
jgi:hypothetical protein